jgi:hypothetical protein
MYDFKKVLAEMHDAKLRKSGNRVQMKRDYRSARISKNDSTTSFTRQKTLHYFGNTESGLKPEFKLKTDERGLSGPATQRCRIGQEDDADVKDKN